MAIWAIGDLHFSGEIESKPMSKFGNNWQGHRQAIATNWRRLVDPTDTVILCGDTSWSLELADAKNKDLDFISTLPGQKVILKGNHDYWWTTVKKMEQLLQNSFIFLHNSFIAVGDTAICGTRGWNLPTMASFTQHDEAMYTREGMRLEHSLSAAKAQGFKKIIVALHYPPIYNEAESSVFTELCDEYEVEKCVYGHIHGAAADALHIFQGTKGSTTYQLVACDFIKFAPLLLEQENSQ